MTVSVREHRSVTGLEVEGPCSGTASKRGGPSMSGDNVKPFWSPRRQLVKLGGLTGV